MFKPTARATAAAKLDGRHLALAILWASVPLLLVPLLAALGRWPKDMTAMVCSAYLTIMATAVAKKAKTQQRRKAAVASLYAALAFLAVFATYVYIGINR